MRFPMTVLRAVTLAPALLVSFVLTAVVCALLPPVLGLVAFVLAGGVHHGRGLGFHPPLVVPHRRHSVCIPTLSASAAAP